jgi:DNA-nicking Smr family endonuclease
MTIKDKNVWDTYKHGVRPVQKMPRVSHKATAAPEKAAARAAASTEPLQKPKLSAARPLSENVFNPLERKREKSLRQGSIEIDAKLDLHGMTQTEAFVALTKFMHKCVTAEKRQLLIITGKGKISEGGGVLRRNLGNWLAQLPEAPSILALRPAAPKHGGEGAVYVVLRKK